MSTTADGSIGSATPTPAPSAPGGEHVVLGESGSTITVSGAPGPPPAERAPLSAGARRYKDAVVAWGDRLIPDGHGDMVKAAGKGVDDATSGWLQSLYHSEARAAVEAARRRKNWQGVLKTVARATIKRVAGHTDMRASLDKAVRRVIETHGAIVGEGRLMQIWALTAYTTNMYGKLNKLARGLKVTDWLDGELDVMAATLAYMDRAFADPGHPGRFKLDAAQARTSYRADWYFARVFDTRTQGSSFVDGAPLSTATALAGGLKVCETADTVTKMRWVHGIELDRLSHFGRGEREVLLARGSTYKVVKRIDFVAQKPNSRSGVDPVALEAMKEARLEPLLVLAEAELVSELLKPGSGGRPKTVNQRLLGALQAIHDAPSTLAGDRLHVQRLKTIFGLTDKEKRTPSGGDRINESSWERGTEAAKRALMRSHIKGLVTLVDLGFSHYFELEQTPPTRPETLRSMKAKQG